jgi:ornithine cyclodeaminase
MSQSVAFLDADAMVRLMPPADAVRVIEDALSAGLDPAADPARGLVRFREGDMLLMPAEVGRSVGIKLATVSDSNGARGLPRIQGSFVLFDGETLTPIAVMDGSALTTLRTPAMSIAAVRHRLISDSTPLRVLIFGAGPQGIGHVATLAGTDLGGREIAEVVYAVRREVALTPAMLFCPDTSTALIGSPDFDEALERADLVVCATSSTEPLFDSSRLKETVVVIAVGSHEPEKRELDSALLRRAQVVVEDRATALREAGDVIIAIAEGVLAADDLVQLADLARGTELATDRPVVFKSTGMSWQDVVVAEKLHKRWSDATGEFGGSGPSRHE